MHIIMWEYEVGAHHIHEFEEIYGTNGTWTELFLKGSGYIGTELLRDEARPNRYLTIDRWAPSESYETFHAQFKKEYATLDAQCEGLNEHEVLLGKWESVDDETR